MLSFHRVRGPAVVLGTGDATLPADIHDTHHAVLQFVDGPCTLTLPRCSGAHLLMSGQIVCRIHDCETWVPTGTLQVGDAQDKLAVRVPAQSRATILHFYFAPAWLNPLPARLAKSSPLLPIRHEPSSDSAQVMSRLARNLAGMAADQALGADELHRYLNDLVATRAEHEPLIARCPGYNRRHRLDLFLRLSRAHELLLYGLDPSLSIDELARCASISPSHFVRQFHRVFGTPPHRYRLQHQMQRAYRLLAEHRLSVSEVISRIGMESHCSFARAFKRQFGKCASQVIAEARDDCPTPRRSDTFRHEALPPPVGLESEVLSVR